ISERMEKIRFHGAHRASDNPRDFLVAQLLIDPQHQRRPLFWRQPPNGRANNNGSLSAHQALEWVFRVIVDPLDGLDRLSRWPLYRDAIQTRVDANAIQPRAQRRVTLEIAQSLKGPH